jgi:hypothetical protein
MAKMPRRVLISFLVVVVLLGVIVVSQSKPPADSDNAKREIENPASTQHVTPTELSEMPEPLTPSPQSDDIERGDLGETQDDRDDLLDWRLHLPWIANPPKPATHYVSKTGSNADGRTWATAWSELDQVDWDVVEPGDTILVDGGATEMIYTTPLVIQKSGTPTHPITIVLASEPGRDGSVVIFGGRSIPLPYCGQRDYQYEREGVHDEGILLDQVSWVVIDGRKWSGFVIYGHGRSGIRLYQPWGAYESYPLSEHITLRGIEIYDNGHAELRGEEWRPNGEGVELSGRHITFERVIVHDNGQDAFQTGGLIEDITVRQSWLYNTRKNPTREQAFNYCRHPDGIQIYAGGTQHGLLVEETVIGPGFMQGVILGQTSTRNGAQAIVNDVTLRNVLFTKAGNANIMGYPSVKSERWVIDHVTEHCMGECELAIFLEGNDHIVRDSIFFGGHVHLPDGLETSSGNCQWNTSGFELGWTADPAFIDVNERNPLSLDDYALAPGSTCLDKGSSVTSVAQLLASVGAEKSSLDATSPMKIEGVGLKP